MGMDETKFPFAQDRFRYTTYPCPRCGRPGADRYCATCGTHWTAHDEMAEAMNRTPDPSTDEGYGPRAVND